MNISFGYPCGVSRGRYSIPPRGICQQLFSLPAFRFFSVPRSPSCPSSAPVVSCAPWPLAQYCGGTSTVKHSTYFGDRDFFRELIRLALPIAAQSFMLSAVGVADTLMLGGLEQNAMSAVSLATRLSFIQNMILSSVVVALVALGAQYWGKRDTSAMSRLFSIALRLNAITSLVFFLACFFFPSTLMLAFTDDAELIRLASEYLRVASWSYLITGISQCYMGLLKISEHASDTAAISTTAVLANIGLNAVFIFGLLGFDRMGVRGAALATLVARIIELIWSVALSFGKRHLKPNLRELLRRDAALTQDFYRCMLPILGASLLWGVGFTAYSAFMGHIDQDAPAANSVAASVIELVCCACNGLASGGGILVGNALGAGDLKKGKTYGIRLLRLSVPCGILTSLVMLGITPLVLSIVRLNNTALTYLRGMMLVMSVYTIGRVMNSIIINGIFVAGGDTLFDVYSLAVAMWGIALPLAALGTFVFHWPVWLVYACTCLDEVGKIPWVLLHFRRYIWVKDLTRETA
ncbi:MAG: MATE family efflux transporter [Clostridia bacterium]|nr:MATE family efflux transporter [Clostridia bacterium]